MGLRSRNKGKRFERSIATIFREQLSAIVHRSSQAERAYQADVFFENGPHILQRLWVELTDAADPDPVAKLEQAERDVERLSKIDPQDGSDRSRRVRLPIVVWHKLRERRVWATMRLDTMRVLLGDASGPRENHLHGSVPATILLDDLIRILKVRTPASTIGPPDALLDP